MNIEDLTPKEIAKFLGEDIHQNNGLDQEKISEILGEEPRHRNTPNHNPPPKITEFIDEQARNTPNHISPQKITEYIREKTQYTQYTQPRNITNEEYLSHILAKLRITPNTAQPIYYYPRHNRPKTVPIKEEKKQTKPCIGKIRQRHLEL